MERRCPMAARGKSERPARSKPTVARRATYSELQDLLAEHPVPLQKAIGLPGARLMLPVDGQGARVLVGVSENERKKIPSEVTMEWQGQHLIVPLEVDKKY